MVIKIPYNIINNGNFKREKQFAITTNIFESSDR